MFQASFLNVWREEGTTFKSCHVDRTMPRAPKQGTHGPDRTASQLRVLGMKQRGNVLLGSQHPIYEGWFS